MIKLLKLELQKNKLLPYTLATFAIFIFGLGFCFLTAFIPQLEGLYGTMPTVVDVAMFTQWDNFISLISIMFVAGFGILSAVMHTKFTVEEYTGKGAILLFSYPQSKSKILFVKCSLVFFFTFTGCLLSSVLAILIFALCANTFGIMPQPFSGSMVSELLSILGVSSFMAASIGLIAMRVGFWKKSMVATVVASVLLITPFSNALSLLPQYSDLIRILGMGILLLISLLLFLELFFKVNKMEAL